MAEQFPGFLTVSKDYLLSREGEISFDLFIDPAGKKVKEPILLVAENTHTLNIRMILTEKQFDSLLI